LIVVEPRPIKPPHALKAVNTTINAELAESAEPVEFFLRVFCGFCVDRCGSRDSPTAHPSGQRAIK
jgi:hypothetical protein